jgi:hypothetical protein
MVRVFPPSDSAGADSVTAGRVQDPGRLGKPMTLLAGWMDGRVASFWVDAPWGTTRNPFVLKSAELNEVERWSTLIVFSILPFAAALLFALRNLRAGRGDRRGATRLAVCIFLAYMFTHLVLLKVPELGLARTLEIMLRQAPIGHSLLHAFIAWLVYMALEPYLRRLWPRVLVSWQRLVTGRLRDPMIGRDILAGFVFAVVNMAGVMTARNLSTRLPVPDQLGAGTLDALSGVRFTLAEIMAQMAGAPQVVMAFFTLLLICRVLLRSDRVAIAATTLLFGSLFAAQGVSQLGVGGAVLSAMIGTISFTYVALRFGFLAGLTGGIVTQIVDFLPWTTDLSAWYSNRMLIGVVFLGALLAYGFVIALGGRSIFRDLIQEASAQPRARQAPHLQ